MIQKKLLLFGAGKIGRSFIGQVFSRSGYEVVFVDINRQLIDQLNQCRQYKVVIKGQEGDEIIQVTNVRGIHLSDIEQVADELADASIAALSVGQQGLTAALPIIARALILRKQKQDEWPLDIIIAENMRNADQYIQAELSKLLPDDYPIDQLLGLVETSIGKMVPIMSQKDVKEDGLQVFAESYNSLIVAKNGFKNPVPDVSYLAPKENIKAWVDRKIFIHNLGHAAAAYLGFRKNPRWVYIADVLNDAEIYFATRQSMLQSADILMSLYPGEFTLTQLEAHIDDLLERFKNKSLGDTVFRVGCDLYRKLSPEDRLAGPIHAAVKQKMPFDFILNVLMAAISFRAKDEMGHFYSEDEKFFVEAERGSLFILKKVCNLDWAVD